MMHLNHPPDNGLSIFNTDFLLSFMKPGDNLWVLQLTCNVNLHSKRIDNWTEQPNIHFNRTNFNDSEIIVQEQWAVTVEAGVTLSGQVGDVKNAP